MHTYVGKPMPRLEDRRFLTGAGRYTADLDLPEQAHAVVVRAPHAHARIAGIDTAAARNAPGVLAVYTSEDFRAVGIGPISLPRRRLVMHVFLHEVRHLAQLALAARAAGIAPPGNHDLFLFEGFD